MFPKRVGDAFRVDICNFFGAISRQLERIMQQGICKKWRCHGKKCYWDFTFSDCRGLKGRKPFEAAAQMDENNEL